jgi:probable F420-dependent oxidoreductase
MKIGVQIRPTDSSIHPAEMARMVEAHGFESLFFPEHTHIPLATESLEPENPGWLETCMHMLDPFVALMAAASATTDLRLGTGVSLIPQHDPIVLAKEVATLDRLSGGRFLFGIGAGWNEVEMRHHRVDPAQRWARLREHVLAMKALWTQERAEFHGRFVDFGPSFQWPKPLQQPHPPLLIGGEGPRVLDRVIQFGDAWMPNDHPEAAERVRVLRRRLDELGRPTLPVTIYSCDWDRSALERYRELGVERCVFTIASFDADGIERGLSHLKELVGDLMHRPS